jgi:hypothetical protein
MEMFYLILVQMVGALLYVAYLTHRYALPRVSPVVKVLVYLTWLASFCIVVLLPYDIYRSLQGKYSMGPLWKGIYYAIMLLTWIVLPVAQEYQTAGEFTRRDRMRTAVKNNLIIYGVFAVIAGLFLVYLFLKDELDLGKLLPLAVAASNAFGMFLVVIFLSHGLVSIPKTLWREKNLDIQLKLKQFNAVGLSHKKMKVVNELELKVKELYWHQKKNGETPEGTYITSLIPQPYRDKWRKSVPDLGEVNLIKIHTDIKEMILELERLERRWEELCSEAFRTEDILANASNPARRIESTLMVESKYEWVNTGRWLWECKVKPRLHPALAVLFSLFAGAVVVAELGIFIPPLQVANPFRRILLLDSLISLDLSLMVVMAYVVFCVYYSLFKLKFASFYGLYWNRQTDAASLLFFAMYPCRHPATPAASRRPSATTSCR